MTAESMPSSIVPIEWVDDAAPVPTVEPDPGLVMLTCANCGATMDQRKCKLICRCGYFLSCSDYY
jgi:exosome complex RNA-binding protein Csl4